MMRTILLGFLSLILVSCNTLNFIEIDVQKPARIILGAGFNNITIVNNTVSQPESVGHWEKFSKETESVNVKSDSLNTILNEALAQFMEEDGSFSNIKLYDNPLRADKDFLMETPLTPDIIKKIKQETGANAIFSLDKFILTSAYSKIEIKDKVRPWSLCTSINARYRVYSTETGEKIREVKYNDSICWRGSWEGADYYSEDIPTYEKAFKHITLRAADKIAKAFSSSWKTETRWYYTDGSTQMKTASAKASGNNWIEAATIWGDLYEQEKKDKKRAKLAANIALGNEMIDDIENAVLWIDIALSHFNNAGADQQSEDVSLAKKYKQKLDQRLVDFNKLNIQFGTE